jgi:hypothetical protein
MTSTGARRAANDDSEGQGGRGADSYSGLVGSWALHWQLQQGRRHKTVRGWVRGWGGVEKDQ